MQNEISQQWTEYSNKMLASFKELGEINAAAAEKMTQQNIEFYTAFTDKGAKQFSVLSEAKGYKEVMDSQASLAAEFNGLFMDSFKQASTVLTESKDNLSTWFEKGLETYTSAAQEAASAAKPAASSPVKPVPAPKKSTAA